jgi:hypothetical protein
MNFGAQLAVTGEKPEHIALFNHANVALLTEPKGLF